MGKTSPEGKQKIIEAAATMLSLHGLRGISIREVTKFAGAPLGSTYHNFPGGKHQIVTEAVTWAGEQATEQLKACLAMDGKKGISIFLTQWRKRLTNSEFCHGCPIVAAAIETPEGEEGEQVKKAVSQVFKNWQSLLEEHLINQGYSPESSQKISLCIIASIEGAVLLCRGHQDIQPFDAIAECIPMLIESMGKEQ